MNKNVCRLCLNDDNNLINLYDSVIQCGTDDFLVPVEVISTCIGLEFSESDPQMTDICMDCSNKLSDFYVFRQKCWDSNYLLTETLSCNLKIEYTTTEEYGNNFTQEQENNENYVDELFKPQNLIDQNASEDYKKQRISNCKYACHLKPCSAKFKLESNYKKHLADHQNPNFVLDQFWCNICDLQFYSKKRWYYHQQTKHKPSNRILVKCDICGENILKYKLKRHQMKHTNERPYKCDICNKSFQESFYLKVHKRIHFNEKPYQCFSCDRKFLTSSKRSLHMTIHSGVTKPFQCRHCSEVFKSTTQRKLHERKNHNENQLESTTNETQITKEDEEPRSVNQKFITDENETEMSCEQILDFTKNQRTFPMKFSCDQPSCKAKFKTKETYLKHLDDHTNPEFVVNKFVCSICDVDFCTSSRLRYHQEFTHLQMGKRPFRQCEICGKYLSYHVPLERHYQIHTGAKPYKCDICHKSFTDKSYLKIHQRGHTNEKPFVCQICDDRFVSSGRLSKHMSTHSDERPYPCRMCSKTFKNAHNRWKHEQETHSRARHVNCKVCDKWFTRNTALKVHMRIHTGERPYPCTECSSKFIQKHVLRNHLKSIHNIDWDYSSAIDNNVE